MLIIIAVLPILSLYLKICRVCVCISSHVPVNGHEWNREKERESLFCENKTWKTRQEKLLLLGQVPHCIFGLRQISCHFVIRSSSLMRMSFLMRNTHTHLSILFAIYQKYDKVCTECGEHFFLVVTLRSSHNTHLPKKNFIELHSALSF